MGLGQYIALSGHQGGGLPSRRACAGLSEGAGGGAVNFAFPHRGTQEPAMPRVRLAHRVEFCAGHQLLAPGLSEAASAALYGPCSRPHGHNYLLEVVVEGPLDPRTGMVMDLNLLASLVRERIVQRVDHRDLNRDVDFLRGAITTGESLLVRFWEQLAPALPAGVRLAELRLQETREHAILYRGPAQDSAPTSP